MGEYTSRNVIYRDANYLNMTVIIISIHKETLYVPAIAILFKVVYKVQ